MAGFIIVDSVRKQKQLLEERREQQKQQNIEVDLRPIVAIKSRPRKLGAIPTPPRLSEALKGLSEIFIEKHKSEQLSPSPILRTPKYESIDSLPATMHEQIKALLEQKKTPNAVAKLFDTTAEVIEQLKAKFKAQETLKKPEPRILLPKAEPPKTVTVKVLEPAKAGEKKKQEVLEERIEEPEYLEEAPKAKPRAMLSRESLRQRFRKLCRKSHKGAHWHYPNWKGAQSPLFTVDGKAVPVREAAYALFKEPLAAGFKPIAQCGIYNCVSPDHLHQVPEEIARSLKRPAAETIREIRRLSSLGHSTEQIVQIMCGKVDPHTVYKVEHDLGYWGVQ